jgi:hypothetical protein
MLTFIITKQNQEETMFIVIADPVLKYTSPIHTHASVPTLPIWPLYVLFLLLIISILRLKLKLPKKAFVHLIVSIALLTIGYYLPLEEIAMITKLLGLVFFTFFVIIILRILRIKTNQNQGVREE